MNPASLIRKFATAGAIPDRPRAKPNPITWYTGNPWANGHTPMQAWEKPIAQRAAARGIRQSAGGYFYTADNATRPIASDWDQLEEWLDAHPPQARPANPNAPEGAEYVLLVLAVAVLLIALFVYPAFAQDSSTGLQLSDGGRTLTAEQHHAAQVAAGEVSAQQFGPIAYGYVLCSMVYRVEADQWPSTLGAVVASGYYGHPRPLTPTEYKIALDVFVSQPPAPCGDPFYYVLGQADVDADGLRPGDHVFTHTLPSGRVLAAHFYEASPWP
jgi:hypothetical protein